MSLRTSIDTLLEALHDIKKLAREAEKPKKIAKRALDTPTAPIWSLALDEICDTGVDLRPRLPLDGPRDFTGPERMSRRAAVAARLLSHLLGPIKMDPLTVADDSDFLTQIEGQPNVPKQIKQSLRILY